MAQGQPAVFQVTGISPGSPSDPLTYVVAGSTSASASGTSFVPISSTEGTATVSANGVVTVTPAAGFAGDITVLVGVRDQTDRTGKGLTDVSNYDVKQFTVDVSGSTPVNRAPIAQPVTATASAGAATQIQLAGISGTTGTNQNLTYAIATQPDHGTVTLVNASTGLASYTPIGNFTGSDSFTYTVTDNGITPALTSTPGTVTVNVTSGVTGAVRLINNDVLVVTPPPNPKRQQDQIAVNEVGGNIQVEVNGVLDSTQPAASSLDEIVIYGSKTGTSTVVSPAVDVPVSARRGPRRVELHERRRLGRQRDPRLVRPQRRGGGLGQQHDRRPEGPPAQGGQEPRDRHRLPQRDRPVSPGPALQGGRLPPEAAG